MATSPTFALYQKPMTREEVLEAYGDYLSQLPDEERERQIDALMNPQPDTSLPTCEIEIVHLDMPYKDAAQERAELETRWEIQEHTETNRITFSMYSGSEWNSPLEVRDYISDEQSGCRIIRRFFMEGAEGHGVRFAAMVDTFAVIQPPKTANENQRKCSLRFFKKIPPGAQDFPSFFP